MTFIFIYFKDSESRSQTNRITEYFILKLDCNFMRWQLIYCFQTCNSPFTISQIICFKPSTLILDRISPRLLTFFTPPFYLWIWVDNCGNYSIMPNRFLTFRFSVSINSFILGNSTSDGRMLMLYSKGIRSDVISPN